MFAYDQIPQKVKHLAIKKDHLSGLAESLGSPPKTTRQAKWLKVDGSLKKIAKAFLLLEQIAEYFEVPPEYFIMDEVFYRKFCVRSKDGDHLNPSKDEVIWQKVLSLSGNDRRILELLLDRLTDTKS